MAATAAWAAPQRSASAFDHLADRIDNDELAPSGTADAERIVAELRALLPPGDAARDMRYRYLNCYLGFNNDARGGFDYATRGLADARVAGDANAEANFNLCRGRYREMLTTAHDALADYDAGVAIARRLENPRLTADALTFRGGVASLLGEQAKALADFVEAQRLYELTHRTRAAESNLLNVATAYRRIGEYDKARVYLDQAKTNAVRRGDVQSEYVADVQLGFLHTEQGHPELGLEVAQEALELAHRMGDRQSIGAARLAVVDALIAQKQHAQAIEVLGQAQADFAAASDRSEGGMLNLDYGLAYVGLGQYARAIKALDVAERELHGSSNLRYLAQLYEARSATYEAMRQPAAALVDLKRAMAARDVVQRMARTQYSTWIGYQFDSQRRDLENRRLRAEATLKEQRLASLERVRNWQAATLLFATLLLLLLAALAVRQYLGSRRLRRMALTDALTGIANRRHIEHVAGVALRQALAARGELCVLLLDIDHFKQVNDRCGHPAGDEVLRRVVVACQRVLRRDDRLGRVGGEEFLIVLPDTTLGAAEQVAERLRTGIEALALDDIVPGLRVSASLGVACLANPDENVDGLIARADAALYCAKRRGRNRTHVASGEALDEERPVVAPLAHARSGGADVASATAPE
ncbi:MAG: diguanylate cyclase [Mizugakiibacter sp.]|uniref:diguanylate cyclase n=1 Tax=Mizugakiibacter sp. TaxID=1972610 RepID=UPI0031C4AA83|nr:diguanylate cyclase [Xanthomonadaceae bacterium]